MHFGFFVSNKKILIFVLNFLFLLQIQGLAQQRVLSVDFEDGKSTDIIFSDEDPGNLPNWNLTWRLFNINIVDNKTSDESSEVEGLIGPVALDFDFQKIFSKGKSWINVRGIAMPDTRYTENESDDLKKRYLSGEINFTQQILFIDKFKKMKMNFSDHSGGIDARGRRYKNVYRVNPEVKKRRSFGLRGGAMWLQQSFDSKPTKYSVDGYSIFSGDKTIFNIGLSTAVLVNMSFKCTDGFSAGKKVVTNSFGGQKAFMMKGLYVDLLYASQIALYGENNEFSGKLASELLDVNDIGIRFGGFRKVSKVNSNIASFYFFDIGWFPSALKDFRINLGSGITFGPFKVKQD